MHPLCESHYAIATSYLHRCQLLFHNFRIEVKDRPMNDTAYVSYTIETRSEADAIARAADFSAQLSRRRSCHAFSVAPVPRADIEAAIRAAGSAPSGAKHQPWHFAVVSSPQTKRAIRDTAKA